MAFFEHGFILWGIFALYGLVVAGYIIWMAAVDKKGGPDKQKGGSSR